jgi:outer membrane protein insertion porin family
MRANGSGTDDSDRWLEAFAGALEAPGIEVVSRLAWAGDLLQGDADASEQALRERAERAGADRVVLLRVSQLGDQRSLDVSVLPRGTGPALARGSSTIDSESELLPTLRSAGRAARTVVLGPDQVSGSAALDAGLGAAAPAAPRGVLRVADVAVSGNRRIDADAVRAVARTRKSEPFSRDQLAKDVRRIYELGFFRDVQVLVDPAANGEIRVEFAVEENPIIRRVTLSGNDNIDGDEIKDKLTLTVGATIDYPMVLENQARIGAYYESKGYYLAKVVYQVESIGDAAVAVNYDVVEGERLRLRDVVFEGNESMPSDVLMQGFQTKPWGLMSFVTQYWDSSGLYAEPVFYQDLDKAQRKYMDAGFIRARLSDPQVDFDEDGIRVTVRVEEGPQFQVGEIQVVGDESMDQVQLASLVQLQPGEVFNRSMLTDDVERLRLHYADLGYYSAEVRPRTDVDPETLTVNCAFEAKRGELHFVDRIAVEGNTRTRDDVVRREMSLVEGSLYSAAALRRSQARIRRLGFFEEVNIEPRLIDGQRVAIDVDVVERPTGTFSFGAGFGSTDGFLLNGSISQDNLFGKGYGLNAQVDAGSRTQRGTLRFTNPFLRGTPTSLSTGFDFSSIEFNDFDRSIKSFGVDLSYPLDEVETRIGTGYSFSDQNIDGFEVNEGVASLLQRERFGGRSTTSALGLSGSRDTRDDIRFPRRGENSGVAFQLAGLGGINQFLRLEARTTRYMPMRFFGRDSTFVFNTRAGYALPLNSLSDFDLDDCGPLCATDRNLARLSDIDDDLELPISERFFLGGVGAFQVRGFESRSLGPRRSRIVPVAQASGGVLFRPINRNPVCDGPNRADLAEDECNDLDDEDIDDFEDLDLTDVVGGNKMFLANLELRVPISEDYGVTGIAFFDVGNAFGENESFNPADLRLGTGLGAEWMSPFGPLVVYLGVPLDPLEDEKATVFEFSLGGSSF